MTELWDVGRVLGGVAGEDPKPGSLWVVQIPEVDAGHAAPFPSNPEHQGSKVAMGERDLKARLAVLA